MTPRRSLVLLVALVVAASVAATAHGLYAVAVSASVPWQVALLYPVITDGLALVAYWATSGSTGTGSCASSATARSRPASGPPSCGSTWTAAPAW